MIIKIPTLLLPSMSRMGLWQRKRKKEKERARVVISFSLRRKDVSCVSQRGISASRKSEEVSFGGWK